MSMNVDKDSKELAASYSLPEKATEQNYIFENGQTGIHQIKWSGGPFMLSRENFMKAPLFGEERTGWNGDLVFAKKCHEEGLKIFLDFSNKIEHRRYEGGMLVNRKAPETEFIKWK